MVGSGKKSDVHQVESMGLNNLSLGMHMYSKYAISNVNWGTYEIAKRFMLKTS